MRKSTVNLPSRRRKSDGEWLAEPVAVRFWRFIVKGEQEDQCWDWAGGKHGNGYGQIEVLGKTLKAHRVSWELHHGPIPKGLMVCHRCDNPPCVNPRHLFLGTAKDNAVDAMTKGRLPSQSGELSAVSKLNNDIVREMRAVYATGVSLKDLAARYGTTRSNVYYIVKRFTWRNVEDARAAQEEPERGSDSHPLAAIDPDLLDEEPLFI